MSELLKSIASIGAKALLVAGAAGALSPAIEAQETIQPTYVFLPDWACDQRNSLRIRSAESINLSRPQTSVTDTLISVTYPIDTGEGNKIFETVIYDNPDLQAGQILRYYSDSSECSGESGTPVIK